MQLPEGSKIRIEQSNSDTVIIIPYAPNSSIKEYAIIFIIYAVLWGFYFLRIAFQIMNGETEVYKLLTKLFFGFILFHSLYVIFRSPINESFILKTDSIKYDSGIPPYELCAFGERVNPLEKWSHERTRVELFRSQLKTLSLL